MVVMSENSKDDLRMLYPEALELKQVQIVRYKRIESCMFLTSAIVP